MERAERLRNIRRAFPATASDELIAAIDETMEKARRDWIRREICRNRSIFDPAFWFDADGFKAVPEPEAAS